jgi:hypothetical protein
MAIAQSCGRLRSGPMEAPWTHHGLLTVEPLVSFTIGDGDRPRLRSHASLFLPHTRDPSGHRHA